VIVRTRNPKRRKIVALITKAQKPGKFNHFRFIKWALDVIGVRYATSISGNRKYLYFIGTNTRLVFCRLTNKFEETEVYD